MILRAVLALTLAAPLAAQVPADTVRYQIRPGDTLIGLAKAYMQRPDDYRAVATLNHVADVYRIPIGTTLTIPRALLRDEPLTARVTAFRGEARIGAEPARTGLALAEGTRIETGANSALSFVMADRSLVTLPSQTRLTIRRLRRLLLTGETERRFVLESGRSTWSVTPAAPGAAVRFEVQTPIAVAAVRGTEFRVAFDGDAVTTGTLRGRVGVAGAGGAIDLPAGSGAVSTAGSVGAPSALLKPPRIVMPIVMETDGTQLVTLRPAGGEARYRVEIAADRSFADLRQEMQGAGPLLRLPPLANGNYYLRVTAFDANGLEGLPATFAYDHGPPGAAPGPRGGT